MLEGSTWDISWSQTFLLLVISFIRNSAKYMFNNYTLLKILDIFLNSKYYIALLVQRLDIFCLLA